jgi:hypothetical protein
VAVPLSVAVRPRVVLQVKRALTIPLPDIEVDDEGVRATLTFGGQPFRCTLPWTAVFSLVADDGEVTVWPLELPAEVAPDRSPFSIAAGRKGRTEHPGHPVSLPPPSLGPKARLTKKPTSAPLAAAEDERPQAHSPSVIPGSVKAASRIPRAPAVPKSMVPIAFEELPAEEPVKPAKKTRSDSSSAASRAMRANDSLSLAPKKPRGEK